MNNSAKTICCAVLISGSLISLVILLDRIQKKAKSEKLWSKDVFSKIANIPNLNLVNRFHQPHDPTTNIASVSNTNDPVRMKPIENPGAGDCLFWCFKQALDSVGKQTSIEELRACVADSVDENTFEFVNSIFQNAVQDKNYEVQREFGFMRNINSLEDMKKAMLCSNYWGDEHAMIALEEYCDLQAFVLKHGVPQKRPGVVRRKKGILLDLRNEHYRLYASDSGKTIFNTQKIPDGFL